MICRPAITSSSTTCTFTSSFVLYRQLEEATGIELRVVPQKEGRSRLEDFDARIDERTRLVSVAWVSNRNGYRHDLGGLAEIAHAKGAFVFTDAVQAIGTFPTNLTELGVDFLAAGAYKWLFANFGVAPFFIREEHLDRISPDRYGHGQVAETLTDGGWSSSHRSGRSLELRFRHVTTAEKYEHASLAYSAVAQLDAALGYLKKVGLSRIEEHTVGTRPRVPGRCRQVGIRDVDARRQPVTHRQYHSWTRPRPSETPSGGRVHRGHLPRGESLVAACGRLPVQQPRRDSAIAAAARNGRLMRAAAFIGPKAPIDKPSWRDRRLRGEIRVSRFAERLFHCWHPVAYGREVPQGTPYGSKLLDTALVVWRTADGAPHVMRDVCIHRGTALSLGRLEDDCLVCPYHAWRYDATGACVKIPQQAGARIPLKARVRCYRALERYGLIWVALEDPMFPLPEVPELEDDEWKVVLTGPFEWQSDASRQVENFTDFGHFPWVHPGLLGDPERPLVPTHEVEIRGHVLHYSVVRPEAANTRDFPVFANKEVLTPERRSRYELHLPYSIALRLGWGGDKGMVYFFASQPISEKRCRGYCLIGRNYDLDSARQRAAGFREGHLRPGPASRRVTAPRAGSVRLGRRAASEVRCGCRQLPPCDAAAGVGLLPRPRRGEEET